MSGALLETQLARSWLPCGLGNRRAGTETEICSGAGGIVSSLRVLVSGGSGSEGDAVVCGSITIGNRQPTEVMPITPPASMEMQMDKGRRAVRVWCKSRHEEEGGASDVEGEEGSLLNVTGRKEPTKSRE